MERIGSGLAVVFAVPKAPLTDPAIPSTSPPPEPEPVDECPFDTVPRVVHVNAL